MRRPAAFLITLSGLLSACDGAVLDSRGSRSGDLATPVLPRLTAQQWRHQIEDVFGTEAPRPALPADTNPYLFYSIGATSTELSERGAQQYADAAAAIAEWALAEESRRQALLGCTPSLEDHSCLDTFVQRMGLALFRRPLRADERARWKEIIVDTARGDVLRGLRIALTGLLQSPHFLYRVELGEPDPSDPRRRRYTSYEMAQRMAFLLWNRGPDQELLDAAASGDLLTDDGLRAQAERLLASPHARDAVQTFFAQYFGLDELAHLDRDPELHPAFTSTLPHAMRSEIELVVDDLVFRRDEDIRELFSSRRTFVNRELAELYGVEAAGASDVAFTPVELPASGPRAGLLTTAGFLSMNAHRTETSPTLRGKFVLERVLCQEVPSPPNDAELAVDGESGEAKTLRQRLEQHVSDELCASCHRVIDPPGFLFEGFDSIGAERETDNGEPVDTSGGLSGIDLADASELAQALRSDERVPSCLVDQLYRHAHGRLETAADTERLEALKAAFAKSGYRFQALLVELVMSEGFRTLAAKEQGR